MKIQLRHSFEKIISIENLIEAWKEFIRGKRAKRDAQEFALRLMDNIFTLHQDLIHRTYTHGGYQEFHISDPKPRVIHKASVRDRLLHHAIYHVLYPFFDRAFASDSFSCRNNKGAHRAMNRFREFTYIVSKNNTRTCWVLKCDIRKFFASINHALLLNILREYVSDVDTLWLLERVIMSFHSIEPGIGLPLGNLTSQLFANVYMNIFDQFVKHRLRVKHYIRYADDFVIFSDNRAILETFISQIESFLCDRLRLQLHPRKVSIETVFSGVDFLGWVHFPDHRVLRTATKRRMMKRLGKAPTFATRNSYLGLLKHGNTHKIIKKTGLAH